MPLYVRLLPLGVFMLGHLQMRALQSPPPSSPRPTAHRVAYARPRRQVLHIATRQRLAVAHAIGMAQRPLHHIREYLYFLVGVQPAGVGGGALA